MPHVELTAPGGVDQLRHVATDDVPAPRPDEIVVRQTAAGLNFVDLYQRSGRYTLPRYPAILGIEAVGVIEALGRDVTGLAVGERVAYAGALGGYATRRTLPAWRAIAMPDAFDDATAATLLARGITVHMLLAKIYPVGAGTRALIHSAAGGLGSMLVRAAKRAGATVIGTVGSPAKAELARAAGADHVLIGRDLDFAAEVARLAPGGVDVAYDGVGGTTLRKTFACVRPFGTVASFGEAAGPIPPIHVDELSGPRSLLLARPSVLSYMQDPATYRAAAIDVIAAARDGILPARGPAFALADIAAAHRSLADGTTTGAAYLSI